MVVGMLVGPLSGSAAAATPDTTRNSTWTSFGNNSNTSVAQWNGGDSTIGVALPDGRISFAFSDTMRGPVTPEGFRPPFQDTMVHNSMVIASSKAANASLTTVTVPDEGNNWDAQSLVSGPLDNGAGKLWAGDGGMYSGQLVRFYAGVSLNKIRCYKYGESLSTVVAKFNVPSGGLPTLQHPASTVDKSNAPKDIYWGTALLNDGGYTYIYGSEDKFDNDTNCALTGRRLHIARVPTGQFDGPWEQVANLAMPNGVFTEFSVAKLGSTYLLVTQDYGNHVIAYASSTPSSFGGTPTQLYTIPNYKSVLPGYAARMQPALTTSSAIEISYNMNTSRVSKDGCLDENKLDASIYRPRFVTVPRTALPTAASAASTAAAVTPAKPGTISQRPPALTWNNTLAAGAGATAKSLAPTERPATASSAAVAAAIPIPVGSITWVDGTAPCGASASPSNFKAVPGLSLPSQETLVSWDYKGPTVDTTAYRKGPDGNWNPIPVMLYGASPLPTVPATAGPAIALLSGSPQRVRWTDLPLVSSGTITYKLCMKPANVFLNETRDCRTTSVTVP
jgi:hypothetical protein